MTEGSLRLAIKNVASWGDTDVLPYPLENHWLHDDENSLIKLLSGLDTAFGSWLTSYPLTADKVLAGVGYMGFRGATQIDPIWNVYLLALVIELGPEIESTRLSMSAGGIFAYRFAPDPETSSLFDRDSGWTEFQHHALDQCEKAKYVLAADISDFYPRVYHHRIKNALDHATKNKEAVRRIDLLLRQISGGVSYGLPIGGNAARLLAELLLNRTDRLLRVRSRPSRWTGQGRDDCPGRANRAISSQALARRG